MPSATWIVVSFIVGTLAMLSARTIQLHDLHKKNIALNIENEQLRKTAGGLITNVENKARGITIQVLSAIVDDLKIQLEKEQK